MAVDDSQEKNSGQLCWTFAIDVWFEGDAIDEARLDRVKHCFKRFLAIQESGRSRDSSIEDSSEFWASTPTESDWRDGAFLQCSKHLDGVEFRLVVEPCQGKLLSRLIFCNIETNEQLTSARGYLVTLRRWITRIRAEYPDLSSVGVCAYYEAPSNDPQAIDHALMAFRDAINVETANLRRELHGWTLGFAGDLDLQWLFLGRKRNGNEALAASMFNVFSPHFLSQRYLSAKAIHACSTALHTAAPTVRDLGNIVDIIPVHVASMNTTENLKYDRTLSEIILRLRCQLDAARSDLLTSRLHMDNLRAISVQSTSTDMDWNLFPHMNDDLIRDLKENESAFERATLSVTRAEFVTSGLRAYNTGMQVKFGRRVNTLLTAIAVLQLITSVIFFALTFQTPSSDVSDSSAPSNARAVTASVR